MNPALIPLAAACGITALALLVLWIGPKVHDALSRRAPCGRHLR
jgi:hypothetical protein